MGQQLKVPAALLKDPGSIPGVQFPIPTWQLTTVCNSSSRGSDSHIWTLRALHSRGAQTFFRRLPGISLEVWTLLD